MKKITLFAVAGAVAVPLLASSAYAQFAKPEAAINYRQSAMTLMASHFGRMQPVFKGQAPYDAAAIKANVAVLQTIAALPWAAFGTGTQKDSNAKPDVWTDAAGFKAAQDKFSTAMTQLVAAADAGDLDKLRAASGDVGSACKGCHDKFQVKK